MKEPAIESLIKKVLLNLASTIEMKQFESWLNYSEFNKKVSSDSQNNDVYLQGISFVFEFGNVESNVVFV